MDWPDGAFTPRVLLAVELGGAVILVALRLGGVFFQRLMVMTCPKAYNVRKRRRVWALVPSGSSNETDNDDEVPEEYVEGSRTQEGFWVMVRVA